MRRTRAALAAAWEFVVGDDWVTAAGVVLALGLVAVLAGAGVAAWWIMPVAALALLVLSVRREARSAARARGAS
jgi:divalent metal cation (Fe/Co/Zn/Cd) transporter